MILKAYTVFHVIISLLASTLFLVAVAMVYAATGTLNLADLSGKPRELRQISRRFYRAQKLLYRGP